MIFKKIITLLVLFLVYKVKGQQDAQYTQYMYNTMTVNPGYAGSKGHGFISSLGRVQWLGLDGAPSTQTIAYDTPLGYTGFGLGVSLVADQTGPSKNTSLGVNGSYKIPVNDEGNISLGLKLGGRFFSVDWSKGKHYGNGSKKLSENISEFRPELGFGLYYFTEKWYVGTAIPNILHKGSSSLTTENNSNNMVIGISKENLHSFTIIGFVFDINENLKFKPTGLLKTVSSTSISFDVSVNLMYQERFTGGLSYRFGNHFSAMGGIKATRNLFLGYSYDLTTTALRQFNSGTHEIVLTYDFIKKKKYRSPRFF